MVSKKWFETWFDSPYYHILYKNRNVAEAEFFINNLLEHLGEVTNKTALDLACGKGRHSIYLNSKGLNTIGIDISPQSIAFAKQFESSTLHFFVHDMRFPLQNHKFDYVFNLFTSFGYFETENENLDCLKSIKNMLNPDGLLVIDFMNTTKVINNLVANETKNIEGISFELSRKIIDGKIIKDIKFNSQEKDFHFQEKVSALTFQIFLSMFVKADLEYITCFGNYNLDPYLEHSSERMIFIVKNKLGV